MVVLLGERHHEQLDRSQERSDPQRCSYRLNHSKPDTRPLPRHGGGHGL
jgi:hypothetical protein